MSSKLNVLTIIFMVFAITSTFFSRNYVDNFLKKSHIRIDYNNQKIDSLKSIINSIEEDTCIEDTMGENIQENNNLITKFETYMPKDIIFDACIDEKTFLTIKNLVLEKSIFSDYGVISYSKYEFSDSISNSTSKGSINIIIAERIEETYHFINTDIEKINGIVLRKELYLDKGAIFYYTYKF